MPASPARTQKLKAQTVNMTCKAPWAFKVFLAGTFNDWSPTSMPMRKNDEGVWSASLKLVPGHYEYRFIVDGRWCCDPGCCDLASNQCPPSKCVPNPYGSMYRVLEVVGDQSSNTSGK